MFSVNGSPETQIPKSECVKDAAVKNGASGELVGSAPEGAGYKKKCGIGALSAGEVRTDTIAALVTDRVG
jgi:hypothetical protein